MLFPSNQQISIFTCNYRTTLFYSYMAASAEPTGEMNPPKRLRTTELGEERWSGGDEENRGQVDVVGDKIVCVFALLQPYLFSLKDILEVDSDIVFPLVVFHLSTKADSSNACLDCK